MLLDQPWFLNQVVEVRNGPVPAPVAPAPPAASSARWGGNACRQRAALIDLDILLFGERGGEVAGTGDSASSNDGATVCTGAAGGTRAGAAASGRHERTVLGNVGEVAGRIRRSKKL